MIATTKMSRKRILFCNRKSLQEWKVIMHTSNTRARKFSSKVGKIVMALVFASMICGISVAPAFGRDYYDRRGGYHQQDRRVYPTVATTRNLSMRRHRWPMTLTRISRRASTSSSPSILDRKSSASAVQRGPRRRRATLNTSKSTNSTTHHDLLGLSSF